MKMKTRDALTGGGERRNISFRLEQKSRARTEAEQRQSRRPAWYLGVRTNFPVLAQEQEQRQSEAGVGLLGTNFPSHSEKKKRQEKRGERKNPIV